MAITLDSNLPLQGGLFSLKTKHSIKWSKNSNMSDTNIDIELYVGYDATPYKTISLRYNGAIKINTLDLTNLIEKYYNTPDAIIPNEVIGVFNDTSDRTMKAIVKFSDTDGEEIYYQYFTNSISRVIANYNGFLVPAAQNAEYNIIEGSYINIPVKVYAFDDGLVGDLLNVTIGLYNSQGEFIEGENIWSNLTGYMKAEGVGNYFIVNYTFNFGMQDINYEVRYNVVKQPRCNDNTIEVYYVDDFGGVNVFNFPSYKINYNKNYLDFTLQDKSEYRINQYERLTGTLNTHVLTAAENYQIEKLMLSPKLAIKSPDDNRDFLSPTGYVDILLTNKTFNKKEDYSTITPITYTIPFKAVNKLDR